MKLKDKVITPDGPGVVIDIDLPESKHKRYVVKLDIEKYDFNPCYFPHELEVLI